MKKNAFIKLDKNLAGAVIARIYSDGVEVFSASHPGVVAAALSALGVEGLMFHHGEDIESVSSTAGNGKFGCLLPTTEDRLGEKFLDAVIFSQLHAQEGVSFGGVTDISLHVAVHHLPRELVVNSPKTPAPPQFKKELRELNKYIYFPDC